MSILTGINGIAAESIVKRLVRESGCGPIHFNSLNLGLKAQNSRTNRQHTQSAIAHLTSIYGHAPSGEVDWANISPSDILDRAYGIDTAFSFRGWNVGLDVTANPTAVKQKQNKLKALEPLWSQIGIDLTAVIHVSAINPENKVEGAMSVSTDTTKEEFVERLRSLIKSATVYTQVTLISGSLSISLNPPD